MASLRNSLISILSRFEAMRLNNELTNLREPPQANASYIKICHIYFPLDEGEDIPQLRELEPLISEILEGCLRS